MCRLCLGTLLTAIKMCTLNAGFAQGREYRDMFANFCHQYEPSDGMIVHIVGGRRNPSPHFVDAINKIDDLCLKSPETCMEGIVKCIDPEKERLLCILIKRVINGDNTISDDTVVDVLNITTKKDFPGNYKDLTSLLTGIFIYVVKNTNNTHKNKYVEEVKNWFEELSAQFTPNVVSNLGETKKEETITLIDNVDENDKSIFKERIRYFAGNHFTSSCCSIVLSSWNETNRCDRNLIEFLTGKEYSDVCEDIRTQNEVSVSIMDGIVKCNSSDRQRDDLITCIDVTFLTLLLKTFASILEKSTKFLGLSNECVLGICDFLARVGCHIKIANRLDRFHWKSSICSFMNSIINSKNALCSISIGLELLAEADMDIFLSTVEINVQEEKSALNVLIIEENNRDVIYHLAYAIKKTAGSESNFASAMKLLFAMSEYSEVFFENMGYVIHLGMPQTMASINSKLGVIKYFFNKNPKLAWKYLTSILPGKYTSSIIPSMYRYYPLSFNEMATDEKYKEIDAYIDLVCQKFSGTDDEAVDMISMFPLLSSKNACCISEALIEKTDVQNVSRKLLATIDKVYSYKGEYDDDKKLAIDSLHQHFLNESRSEWYYELFKFASDRKFDIKTMTDIKKEIRIKIKKAGYGGLVDDANEIEDTHRYYKIISEILADEEIRDLTDYLLETNRMWHLRQFVNSIQSDRIINVFGNNQNMINVLSKHVCDLALFDYVNSLPGNKKHEFWGRTESVDEGSFKDEDFRKVIKLLLSSNNYITAVRLLYYRMQHSEIDCDLIILVLDGCDIAQFEQSPLYEDMKFSLYSLVVMLQKRDDVSSEIMEKIEAKYINFLNLLGEMTAPNVFCRMANDPKYVEEILLERKMNIENGINFSSANTLFCFFRVAPGTQRDMSFNFATYCQWYNYAINEADSDVKDDMMELFGRASYHVNADADGFFIDRNVAEFLEKSNNLELMAMFEIELSDSIGSITVSGDLNEPKRIINELTEKAEMCEREGYLSVAASFRSVSRSLETYFEF